MNEARTERFLYDYRQNQSVVITVKDKKKRGLLLGCQWQGGGIREGSFLRS